MWVYYKSIQIEHWKEGLKGSFPMDSSGSNPKGGMKKYSVNMG